MVYTRPKRPTQRHLPPRAPAYRRTNASEATASLPIVSTPASRARRSSHARNPSTASFAFTDEPRDMCAYIFSVCKRAQAEHLNWRRISCMFDVDSGLVPGDVLSGVGEIVEVLLADIAHNQVARGPGAMINVTLRRKGADWILAVSENVNGYTKPGTANRRLAMIRALAQRIDADCSVQMRSHGSLTAVMFNVPMIDAAGVEITRGATPLH
jgi:hypothetical protein